MSGQAFRVHGLDCAEEVAILKRAVGPLAGGEERLAFDLLAGKMTVPATVDGARLVEAVRKTGMRAIPWREGGAHDSGTGGRFDRAVATIFSGLGLLVGFVQHAMLAGGFLAALAAGESGTHSVGDGVPLLSKIFYTIGIVAGGWFVAPKAWSSLKALRPDMNLLMLLAVVGAVGIGEWFEAATVAFLFALALLLESWSVGRARRAVEALLSLAPATVRVRAEGGEERDLPVADAAVGTRFHVRPGERLALDGEIVAGASDLDQSSITGESVAVERAAGDPVFAGSINGRGALDIRSTKPAEDTTLARILRRVEEARARRSPSEQWVERFARIYTPLVFAGAIAVAVVLPLAFGVPAGAAIYRALALLVIACPCALVVATPVAVVAALASAARHGVLLKGGQAVELPARIRTVALDKTGTLTRGAPVVVEVVPLAEHDEIELLERAAALESSSEHPLAKAIRAYAVARGIVPVAAERFEIIAGKGAEGWIDGRRFWLGSYRFLEERGQESAEVHRRIEEMSAAGMTIVAIGNEDHVCGLVALADELRPEAVVALSDLRRAGIGRIVMLTGDHAPTADVIAREAGVDEVRSELLPEDKLTAIEELLHRDGAVAMVGDGVNDAPALARATLGIAMGAGTDAAIETADVALLSNDLGKLAWLVRHSRRTMAVIRGNIAFALVIKALFLVLALSGWTSLWLAIAADTGATLLVVANALRLLRD